MTISKSTRADVIARDDSRCQWCGRHVNTTGGWYSLQHRRARGMGGSRQASTDGPANLLLVCGTGTTECHGHMEAHPREAAARGFRLGQHEDPEATPYRDATGFWHLLDNQAGRTIAPPPLQLPPAPRSNSGEAPAGRGMSASLTILDEVARIRRIRQQ